jgi:GH15 family glucan-1,4-alpha-glucosidase
MYEGEPQLPIQEDETGVVLHELWSHYDRSRDLEFIEDLYYPLIRRAADFMIGYRNDETGLPKASYDLWEEKIGVHTYTVASVYGGLRSASKIARLLGKSGDARTFDVVADEIKQAMLDHLVVDGIFIKGYSGVGSLDQPDHTADISTVYGLYKYGVLPTDDERLEDTAEHVFTKLRLDTAVGGFARYDGDDYYRSEEHTNVPGNPWFIATLWHSRFCINTADTLDDLKPAQEDFAWVIDHALASGVLSEQVDPYTGEQKSAAPLVWSHAEFIKALLAFEDAVAETKQ